MVIPVTMLWDQPIVFGISETSRWRLSGSVGDGSNPQCS